MVETNFMVYVLTVRALREWFAGIWCKATLSKWDNYAKGLLIRCVPRPLLPKNQKLSNSSLSSWYFNQCINFIRFYFLYIIESNYCKTFGTCNTLISFLGKCNFIWFILSCIDLKLTDIKHSIYQQKWKQSY